MFGGEGISQRALPVSRDLSRLLRPRSIVAVGGGAWCRQIIKQSRRMGFGGDIHAVHPSAACIEGVAAVPDIADLPVVPDAVFLGINRFATLNAVAALSAMGAGGCVCFASGFAEAAAEDHDGADLQGRLVAVAGEMPILGPNCYGFINALDGALLWPDQHGCTPVKKGVAILTQSSNIAINLTMQKRALPIAFTVTCGNMAQTSQAEIAIGLLDDPRVTAIGLHVEGFRDLPEWHALAQKAFERNVPLVVLKVGVSDQARRATITHTASISGSDAGADAFLSYLGIPRVDDIPTFLETLMLLHCNGRLETTAVSSISCSGGEASLIADVAVGLDVTFPDLTEMQRLSLAEALGPMVSLSNPLDYHTYIWGDADRMARAWLPMAAEHIGLVIVILDYPHTDASAWRCATEAAISVRRQSGRPVAVVSTLPELLPPDVAQEFLQAGVTPLHGMREALKAVVAAGRIGPPHREPPLAVGPPGQPEIVSEAEAKTKLARYGLTVPRGIVAAKGQLRGKAGGLQEPLVLKAQGSAHKSEIDGVRLNLAVAELEDHAACMPATSFLVEEMVQDAVAELLVGVVRDDAHGFVLTLATGGILTELWQDSVSLLLPATREEVATALGRLRSFPLLEGYRGARAAHIPAVLDAVMSVQRYVIARAATLYEIEINPLICTPERAVAADALIARLTRSEKAGESNGAR